jgi:hypothetical protein
MGGIALPRQAFLGELGELGVDRRCPDQVQVF